MKKKQQAERNVKVAVVGVDGVGKTALIEMFVAGTMRERCYYGSVVDTYLKQIELDKELVMLDIADSSSEEEFETMRERTLEDSEGYLLAYDISSRESLEKLSAFVNEIRLAKGVDKFPCVVVGTKSDRVDRQVSKEEARNYLSKECAMSWSFPLLESSAKQGTNVNECFIELVRQTKRMKVVSGGSTTSTSPSKTHIKKSSLFGSCCTSEDLEDVKL